MTLTYTWEYRVTISGREDPAVPFENEAGWEMVPNTAPPSLIRKFFERDGNALLAAAGHGHWRTQMHSTDVILRVYKRRVDEPTPA